MLGLNWDYWKSLVVSFTIGLGSWLSLCHYGDLGDGSRVWEIRGSRECGWERRRNGYECISNLPIK